MRNAAALLLLLLLLVMMSGCALSTSNASVVSRI
jgi:hypothetical protein